MPELAASLGGMEGEFLCDLEGLSGDFDDWLLCERNYRRDQIMEVASEAAQEAVAEGKLMHIQEIVRALERIDPANETVARLGMRVDAVEGNFASVHKRFRRLSQHLQVEYSCSPSAETQRIFNDLTSISPVCAEPPVRGSRKVDLALSSDPISDLASKQALLEPPVVVVASIESIDLETLSETIAKIATDDIRTALARHRDLRVLVVDRDRLDHISEVCTTAVSTYLLSSTLRTHGECIRFNVRLSDINSGMVVWADQFAIILSDLDEAVERVVARTTGAIWPTIDRDLMRNPRIRNSETRSAYALYLTARRMTHLAHSLDELRRALRMLEHAISMDPSQVSPRLLAGRLYNTDLLQTSAGHNPAPFRARASALAREAFALDPEHAEAALLLGWCHLRQQNWGEAERCLLTALNLAPLDAHILNAAGFGLAHLAKMNLSLGALKKAFKINPFPTADYHADIAVALMLNGEQDESDRQFEVSQHPALHYLGVRVANLFLLGRQNECSEAVTKLESGFSVIWQGEDPMGSEQILNWCNQFLPLSPGSHRDRVFGALAAAIKAHGRLCT